MRKLFSSIILGFILVSQTQVLQVYATEQQALEDEKQKGEQTLDVMEGIIDTAVEKLDDKIKDEQQSEQLQEKHEEIGEYLEQVQEDIANKNSGADVKELVEEAKKVVVLKVVSGVTEYEDVEENISEEIANTPEEIEDAMESIQESMETDSGEYSLIVRTSYSKKKVSDLFARFDDNTRIENMYQDNGKKYFEIFLKEDSIFKQEMLEDIESGILPETFLGIEIVLPEVYSIGELADPSLLEEKNEGVLQGEDLSQTWGITRYQSYKYFADIKDASSKIRVGIVDTGIDYNHPDLKNNVNQDLGKDFVNEDDDAWDDQGHGTHVAGTIAANINGAGIIGVNPYVELIPLKICTNRGFCPSYAVLRALDYAKQQNIDILNMSLGGRGNPNGHAICGGIQSVVNAGGIVVAASGNSNIDTSRFVPGGCSAAITVAAIDSSNMRAQFSNYGNKVDISAPGVQVYSTYPVNKGSYRKLSGTSMSTPHIVGIVSIMQAYNPNITSSQIKSQFKQYSQSVETDRDYKTIANAVDLESLVASYSVIPTTIQETTVPLESGLTEEIEPQKEVESSNSGDDSTLDPDITWTSDEDLQKKREALDQQDTPEPSSVEIQSVQLNIGDENIKINSLGDESYEREAIDMQLVEQKEPSQEIPEKISYDALGNPVDPGVEINNSNSRETFGVAIGEDFDFENLPDLEYIPSEGVEINSSEEEEESETQELLIDGAEVGVKINSSTESGEPFAFFTGSILIEEQSFSGELLETEEETIDYSYDEEVFIDGAEKGVEINSLGTDEENFDVLELEEYNPDAATDFETMQGDEISGYDESEGVEINSVGDDEIEDEGEIIEIIQNEEIIEEIEYSQEEIFIDGAEKGVEINSVGDQDDAIPEELQLEEYDETQLPELEDITGEQIDLEYIPEEQMPIGDIPDEIVEIDAEIDVIDEIEDDREDIFLEGAESGVEINSLGDDEGPVEVSEKEYLEAIESEKNNTQGEIEEQIETPDELLNDEVFNSEDNIGEDERLEGEFIEFDEDAEVEESTEEDAFGIQNTYYCTIEEGQWCNFSIYRSYRYQVRISNPSITKWYGNKRTMSIQGLKAGRSTYYMFYYGRHYHTIYVDVKAAPKPKDIYVNLEYGTSKYVYLPTSSVYYKYSNNSRWYSTRGNAIYTSSQGGDYTIDVTKGGRTLYKIHVTNAPKKISTELMVGQRLNQYIPNAFWYKYSFSSPGKVDIQTYRSTLYLTGKSASNVQVYIKHPTTGAHLYTIDVKVKSPPKPKEYHITLQEKGYKNIYLPERSSHSIYVHSQKGGTARMYDYNYLLQLQAFNAGNIEYYIKDHKTGILKYIIHVTITAKPPVTINMEMYEGQKVSSRLRYASSHQYTFSHSNYVSTSASSRYLYVTGKKAGNIKIYAKRDGIHRYTINVKIKAVPKPISYNVKVQEGKETNLYLPNKFSYRFYQNGASSGGAYFYNYGHLGYVKIRGYVAGNISYIIKDNLGIHRYTINATVIPIPPEIRTLSSIYETGYVSFNHNHLIPSVSKTGYLSLYKSSSTLHIRGLKAGKVEIYMKDRYGRHKITYKLEVKPKPKPKIYNLKFTGGDGSANVYLPDYIRNYYVSREGDSIYDNLRQYDKHFWIDVERVGSSKIVLRDKTHGFERYIINVVSEPSYEDYSLHVGDNIDVWYHSRYDFREQNNSIVEYKKRGNDSTIYGKKVGKTEVHIYKYGNLKKIWRVNVIPQPKRITVNCTTQVRDECELRVPNSGYYRYTTIPSSELEIESTSKKIEVSAKTSGTVIVYIKAAHGNYVTHVFQVFIKARQADVESCEIPSNRSCETYPITDRHNYTLNVSKTGVVRAYGNILRDANQRKTDKAKLIIEGVSPGYAEVYLYHGRDHVATIKTTVSGPAAPITLDDNSIKLIAGGESKKINILTGGGKYTIKNTDTEQLSISVKTNADNTGILTLKGLKHTNFVERNYYPEILDQWGEVKQLKVKLLAPEMELDEDQITLGVGQSKTINAKNLTGKIASLSRNNNNISITKLSDASFKITGKATGFATAGATDTGGGYDSVLVEVQGNNSSQTDSSDNTKIRYIRDSINGSNKNSWNFWVEIQALEANTGKNIALGTGVTGSVLEKSTKPYSRITDGRIGRDSNYYTHPSKSGVLSYVEVDLGALYDIETVNIFHYYTDNRTFKETKTEVSADGATWHTLYDSAVSGTYIEPTDGSGRSYKVEIESGNRESELEKLLKELFAELGIQSVEDGVEINNNFRLSSSQKNKIDSVIKKWKDTKGREFLLGLKNVTLELKEESKYSSYEYRVILDYIGESIEKQISLKIVDYDYTPNVEDGYIGGFYFKVNNPDLVKEAGIEYFGTDNNSREGLKWEREKLENDGGKEYGTFIMPLFTNTIVRGYVTDKKGNTIYTNIDGSNIKTGITALDYYNYVETGDEDIYAGEDGVEVANGKFYVMLITATALGISGGKCNAYFSENSDFWDFSCYIVGSIVVGGGIILTKGKVISGGTVPTSSVGLIGVIKGFSSKTSVQNLSGKLGVSADKVAQIGNNIKLTRKVIDNAIEILTKNTNDMNHIFSVKHKLTPLVQKLGSQEKVVRAILEKANGHFPANGNFTNGKEVIINLHGYSVYVRGRLIDGIPRISTIYIP